MQPYSICRLEYQFSTIYTFIDLQKVHYDTIRNEYEERKKRIKKKTFCAPERKKK